MQGYMHINDHGTGDDDDARMPSTSALPVLGDFQKYEWKFWWRTTNAIWEYKP